MDSSYILILEVIWMCIKMFGIYSAQDTYFNLEIGSKVCAYRRQIQRTIKNRVKKIFVDETLIQIDGQDITGYELLMNRI